jgi:hypothetical protein
VREVLVDDEQPQATVIVPDDQLSLAIGREGQNARLAARLTGWRVDIRSETEFAKEEQDSGYEEEEPGGRCAAILGNGRRCPNAALPGLALLRPRRPPGARGKRTRIGSSSRRRTPPQWPRCGRRLRRSAPAAPLSASLRERRAAGSRASLPDGRRGSSLSGLTLEAATRAVASTAL